MSLQCSRSLDCISKAAAAATALSQTRTVEKNDMSTLHLMLSNSAEEEELCVYDIPVEQLGCIVSNQIMCFPQFRVKRSFEICDKLKLPC